VSAALPALASTKTESALTSVGARVSDVRLADAAAEAELAARLNPLSVQPLLAASAIAERRGRREDARGYVLRALRRQPYSVDGWIRLAQLEFERGDRAGVRRASERAVELDPRNLATIVLAARAQANSALPE